MLMDLPKGSFEIGLISDSLALLIELPSEIGRRASAWSRTGPWETKQLELNQIKVLIHMDEGESWIHSRNCESIRPCDNTGGFEVG
jgi:hypothetical protein